MPVVLTNWRMPRPPDTGEFIFVTGSTGGDQITDNSGNLIVVPS